MPSTRTQIYLTQAQREKLDALARRDDRSLAELVREAVDHYLEAQRPDAARALEAAFGKAPDMRVPPREEWKRG